MRLILEFDIDADIIDVPQFVIENRDVLQKRFTKWLYNKQIKHSYWVTFRDKNGNEFRGVKYRSDAFVEWLNKKVLTGENEKAKIVAEHVSECPDSIPRLNF